MPINFNKKKKPSLLDGWGKQVGIPDEEKDLFERDRTAKDGPQGGPSFTSGSDQASMPGNSTGEAAVYNAMGGGPGDGYDASWGISVSCKKVARQGYMQESVYVIPEEIRNKSVQRLKEDVKTGNKYPYIMWSDKLKADIVPHILKSKEISGFVEKITMPPAEFKALVESIQFGVMFNSGNEFEAAWMAGGIVIDADVAIAGAIADSVLLHELQHTIEDKFTGIDYDTYDASTADAWINNPTEVASVVAQIRAKLDEGIPPQMVRTRFKNISDRQFEILLSVAESMDPQSLVKAHQRTYPGWSIGVALNKIWSTIQHL